MNRIAVSYRIARTGVVRTRPRTGLPVVPDRYVVRRTGPAYRPGVPPRTD